MITRRELLKGFLLTASATVFGATTSAASSLKPFNGILYTKSNPGKWTDKVGSHAPQINIDGRKVTITTPHPMSQEHYIVRHTLVSEDGTVLGAKTFFPAKDTTAVSTYELPSGYSSKLYATSFCNIHDFWITESKA
jgi:superoxide reductase